MATSRAARTLTKVDIVTRVRDATGLSWNESGDLVEAVFEVMKQSLEGGENIKVSGFGSFSVRLKSARQGRNPQTTERIVISRRRVLTFKPSVVFRAALNGGQAVEPEPRGGRRGGEAG
jgi:integration host factor subunit alpha